MSSLKRSMGCKRLRQHFTKVHSLGDMTIMPIALLPVNISQKEQEVLEEGWILRMNTRYPYGINLRVKKCGIMDAEDIISVSNLMSIYSYFPVVKIPRGKRGGM